MTGASRSGLISVAASCEVESDEGLLGGSLQNLVMAERVDGVVVTCSPMILHGLPRELVVLGITLVAARAIDQVDDVVHSAPGDRGEELGVFALLQVVRQLLEQVCETAVHLGEVFEKIREGAGPDGVMDFFLPRIHFG